MLDGLKKNWEELHLQYQGLSVVTDTAPKKARYVREKEDALFHTSTFHLRQTEVKFVAAQIVLATVIS